MFHSVILFQVQFTKLISLFHCSLCLSFSILGAHTEIISLQYFLWQCVLHVSICFFWFSQLCLLPSRLLGPDNPSHCTLHSFQHGHVFLFHLTVRQAMVLGHMSSWEGHASYKPLSIGKAGDCFFYFLSSQVHCGLLWFGFQPSFPSYLSYSVYNEYTQLFITFYLIYMFNHAVFHLTLCLNNV